MKLPAARLSLCYLHVALSAVAPCVALVTPVPGLRTLTRDFPGIHGPQQVDIIECLPAQCRHASVRRLLDEELPAHGVVGFDCEAPRGRVSGTYVELPPLRSVQLATESTVLVVHVGRSLPCEALVRLLQRNDVRKVGKGVTGLDVPRMSDYWNLTVGNLVDIDANLRDALKTSSKAAVVQKLIAGGGEGENMIPSGSDVGGHRRGEGLMSEGRLLYCAYDAWLFRELYGWLREHAAQRTFLQVPPHTRGRCRGRRRVKGLLDK